MAQHHPLLDSDEFDEWFASKQPDGEGYAEVSNGASAYPHLTFSFRGAAAVVHCFPSSEQVLLLVGDGVMYEEEAHDFPVMDIECAFDGVFISGLHRACCVVREVLRGRALEAVGRWELL